MAMWMARTSGVVYLFDPDTGALLRAISSPTPAAFDLFGSSVAVSETQLVVGAYLDDTFGLNVVRPMYSTRQRVTCCRRSVGRMQRRSDYFGFAVAISGNVVAVGAERVNLGAVAAGAAYLFDASDGSLAHELLNPTPTNFEYFGHAVAISGSDLVVSAYRDASGVSSAGAAYVYDAITGNLRHTLNNPNPAFADFFGSSLAISGDTIVDWRKSSRRGWLCGRGTSLSVLGRLGCGAAVNCQSDSGEFRFVRCGRRRSRKSGGRSGPSRDDSIAPDTGNTYIYDATSGSFVQSLPKSDTKFIRLFWICRGGGW